MTKRPFLYTKVFLILAGSVFLAAFLATGLISCKKKGTSSENAEAAEGLEVQTNNIQNPDDIEKSEFDFYSPAEDDASWVEALLLKIEEERIAEDLAKMEAELADYQLEDEGSGTQDNQDDTLAEREAEGSESAEEKQTEEKSLVEKFFEEEREGKAILGKNQELQFYEFDNEILSPQFTDDGFSIIHSSDSSVSRNFYNKEYQIVKKEEWNIQSLANSKKLKTELFSYSPETKKIIEKEIQTDDYDEIVSYNEESQPLNSKRYTISEEKKYLTQERNWTYDSQNRMISDFQKEYYYIEENYKAKPEIFSRRYDYTYNDFIAADSAESTENENNEENKIPPDFNYYENDVLKMHNKYTAEKGNYISWIYFDEVLSVKTYYEEDVRIRDEYYNKGRLFRTKVYERKTTEEKSGEEEQAVNQTEKQTVIRREAE